MNNPRNIVPQAHQIDRRARQKLNGHKACIVWFTGLSGSGKSTLAGEVEKQLYTQGCRTYILDGDNIRSGLNSDLGFAAEDRAENIRRIGEVARLFVDAGVVVLTAFISPYKQDRQKVRDLVESGTFIEVYVNCPLEVCEERDVKGLYQKARKGEIENFTGIDAPFEAPPKPEVEVRSDKMEIAQAAEQVLGYIKKQIKL